MKRTSASLTSQPILRMADFIEQSSGLAIKVGGQGQVRIEQKSDRKEICFSVSDVDEIISRVDTDGKPFLQVNFLDGRKILLTDHLVGFKPARALGIEMDRLPKVVTTPDLISVVEAIEESLLSNSSHPNEVEVLKKVFDAVILGGETVGFDLSDEKQWLTRLSALPKAANA